MDVTIYGSIYLWITCFVRLLRFYDLLNVLACAFTRVGLGTGLVNAQAKRVVHSCCICEYSSDAQHATHLVLLYNWRKYVFLMLHILCHTYQLLPHSYHLWQGGRPDQRLLSLSCFVLVYIKCSLFLLFIYLHLSWT